MNRKQRIEAIAESFHVIKHQLMAGHKPFKGHPLPLAQRSVLFVLMRKQSASTKDIAEALHISSSAATQLVNVLIKKGCVVRKPNKQDRRSTLLSLSISTRKHMDAMRTQGMVLMNAIFNPLSDTEIAAYYTLSKKVAETIINKASH